MAAGALEVAAFAVVPLPIQAALRLVVRPPIQAALRPVVRPPIQAALRPVALPPTWAALTLAVHLPAGRLCMWAERLEVLHRI